MTASGSWSWGSASLAYEHATKEVESNHISYIDIAYNGGGFSIEHGHDIWSAQPKAEVVADEERLQQFLDEWGSHYIARVSYGFAISMRMTQDKKSSEDRTTFSAEVKVALSTVNGEAKFSFEHVKRLSSENISVGLYVLAGPMSSRDGRNDRILTSWQDVPEFLALARKGAVRIEPAPIGVEVISYFNTLTDFPKSRKLFAPLAVVNPPTPHGVPSGTVIAWYPRRDQIKISPEGKFLEIRPPKVGQSVMGRMAGHLICAAGLSWERT